MAKRMIIKGVGTFMAKNPRNDREVITLGTLQNLKIDFNVEIDDIFGGDGLFAIDTLVRSKSIEISATDAKFELEALQLMMGSEVKEKQTSYIWVLNEQQEALAVGGTPEVTTVKVTGAATATSDVTVTLNGVAYPVAVADADTVNAVASKIMSVIDALPDFSATAAADTVTITATTPVAMTDATFSGGTTGVTATVTITTQGVDGTSEITPNFATTLYANPELSVRAKDSNKLLTRVYSATPAADEFYFNTVTKKVILHGIHAGGDIILNYKRTETVDVTDILVDEVPFPVTVVHHGSFLQKDGSYQGIETELYSCRARGTFTIDAQRQNASATSISLVVIDPERADGKLGSVKRYAVTGTKAI